VDEPNSLAASLRKALTRLDTAGLSASEVRNGAIRALCDMASLAVNRTDTPEQARELLASYDAPRIVHRLLETAGLCHTELLHNPKTGPTPDGGLAANGPSSVVVHLAWLIDEQAAAARMLELALDPVVVARLPKARFWQAYFQVLRDGAQASAVEVPEVKLRGLEKYWFSCMQLAAALINGGNRTPFVAAAHTEFERINRDKRITDWLGVDGDGNAPVKWNLRVTSLLRAMPVATGE
jgi:hypothetical protein